VVVVVVVVVVAVAVVAVVVTVVEVEVAIVWSAFLPCTQVQIVADCYLLLSLQQSIPDILSIGTHH